MEETTVEIMEETRVATVVRSNHTIALFRTYVSSDDVLLFFPHFNYLLIILFIVCKFTHDRYRDSPNRWVLDLHRRSRS
jgi:hypothetical protein